MCLVHRTARDGHAPEGIVRCEDEQQGFLFELSHVENDANVAEMTAAALKRRVSGTMLSDVWFALLSDDKSVDMPIWETLAKVWRLGRRAEINLADENIHAVRKAALRTGGEYNKYLGLTRFKDIGGLFYSELEPDCDLLPLLAEHFHARLPDRGWILHDLRRRRAAVFDTRQWVLEDMDLPERLAPTQQEDYYQSLWREFYRSTTTRERANLKVQRTHMPKKYWKHLIETPQNP